MIEVLSRYSGFATGLGIDLVAILVMSYGLYFRRHGRADLLLSYIALNVGIFSVMSLLGQVKIDIAVGFGLFAILSIIRLRSSGVSQQEVAYYFVALVIGLVNGMNIPDRGFVVIINVLLLVVMALADSGRIRARARKLDVKLDQAYTDDKLLLPALEELLGGKVVYHEVTDLDFIHGQTSVDVRYRPGPGGGAGIVPAQRTKGRAAVPAEQPGAAPVAPAAPAATTGRADPDEFESQTMALPTLPRNGVAEDQRW